MSIFSNKTIIVTGASGLIGSNLVTKLLEDKTTKVIAIGRNQKKLSYVFENHIDNRNLKLLEHDISEPLELNETVDYIFHAAGPMESKIIKERPMDVIVPNIFGLLNCLDFLKAQEIGKGIRGRLVVFSSVTVYGTNSSEDISVIEDDTKITESIDSVSAPYSQTKRFIEVIANAYSKQYGVDAVIGRFSTVYGYTKHVPDTAFFEFINKGIRGENIILKNSNLPKRDNIYIDDAINGILLVAAKGESGETYNISSNGDLGNFASVDEIAQIIADETQGINVLFSENKISKRGPGIKLNNEKLKSLGWDVTYSLKDGISQVIYKYRNKLE